MEWLVYLRRGVSTEGNLLFKIDWASLIVASRFTVFALFYFVLEGKYISNYKPPGAYIWRGDLTRGFLSYRFGGLTFGGAYTWRGLFPEFYGISEDSNISPILHCTCFDCRRYSGVSFLLVNNNYSICSSEVRIRKLFPKSVVMWENIYLT